MYGICLVWQMPWHALLAQQTCMWVWVPYVPWLVFCLQLKATAEKLAFLRQVAIFEGSNTRQLTQLHFVLEKCAVQRGHVIMMEGQPCAGRFCIVTGQVTILARNPSSPPALPG